MKTFYYIPIVSAAALTKESLVNEVLPAILKKFDWKSGSLPVIELNRDAFSFVEDGIKGLISELYVDGFEYSVKENEVPAVIPAEESDYPLDQDYIINWFNLYTMDGMPLMGEFHLYEETGIDTIGVLQDDELVAFLRDNGIKGNSGKSLIA